MSKTAAVVFLFDVDNTLLDNDLVQSHLKEHLADAYGASAPDRYWDILEGLRSELGYVDYLGALERFRVEEMHRPDVLRKTRPSLTGSLPVAKTIGTVEVAALATRATEAFPTITATGRRVKSLTRAVSLSRSFSAERYSVATFWPST
jgi:hypothetical protein